MQTQTIAGHAVQVPDSLEDIEALLDSLFPDDVIEMGDSDSCLGQRLLAAANPEAERARFSTISGKLYFEDGFDYDRVGVTLEGAAYAFFDYLFHEHGLDAIEQVQEDACDCGDPDCDGDGTMTVVVSVADLRHTLEQWRLGAPTPTPTLATPVA